MDDNLILIATGLATILAILIAGPLIVWTMDAIARRQAAFNRREAVRAYVRWLDDNPGMALTVDHKR